METIDTKEVIDDLRNLIEGAEDLLRATTDSAGDKVAQARHQVERSLEAARKQMHQADERLMRRVRGGARAADRHVHASPWNAIGLAAGIGFLVSCLVTRR